MILCFDIGGSWIKAANVTGCQIGSVIRPSLPLILQPSCKHCAATSPLCRFDIYCWSRQPI